MRDRDEFYLIVLGAVFVFLASVGAPCFFAYMEHRERMEGVAPVTSGGAR